MAPNKDDWAIQMRGVTKLYPLYANKKQEFVHAFGLSRLVPHWKPPGVYPALRGIDVTVGKGERVAIVGRNGAGKSTFLKLVAGTIRPTSGQVQVKGKIGALLEMGLGFNDDLTGYMNLRGALAYNNLSRKEMDEAVKDVVSFTELGDHLHQPTRTYSAGMRSRLYFAVATAMHPDILIVDEVLGAGDAYFNHRSAERMARLTGQGCTILLVSHNPGQVMEMCDRAVWIEGGEIQMEGPTPEVMEAYRDFTSSLGQERTSGGKAIAAPTENARWLRQQLLEKLRPLKSADHEGEEDGFARDGVVLTSLDIRDKSDQPSGRLLAGECIKIVVGANISQRPQKQPTYPAVFIFTADGRYVAEQVGPCLQPNGSSDNAQEIILEFDPLLLGPGEYLVTAGIIRRDHSLSGEDKGQHGGGQERLPVSERQAVSMLNYSKKFEVICKDSSETSLVLHPVIWSTSNYAQCEEDVR